MSMTERALFGVKLRMEVLSQAADIRLQAVAEEAIARLSGLPGAGLYLAEVKTAVFQEWALQLADTRTSLFEMHDDIVRDTCRKLAEALPESDRVLIAAFSDGFDEHVSEQADELTLRRAFDAVEAATRALYDRLAYEGVNRAEDSLYDEGGAE